jgi:hypothetical protein
MTAIPGFPSRAEFMARLGKSDFTGRRWQREGRLAVVYFGNQPHVDVERTIAIAREEGRTSLRGPDGRPDPPDGAADPCR